MINLLPEEYKKSFLYARKNTRLARWSMAITGVALCFALLIFGGQWYIQQATKNYAKQVATTQSELDAQNITETQAKVQEVSNSLKLIDQVLSKQILFSKLIRQIGAAMPSGSVMSNIELPALEGGINISAEAKNYKTASQVQLNLADPRNKIFDKADIVSISCDSDSQEPLQEDEQADPYPCTVNVRAEFVKDNPFLFISKDGGDEE